MGVLSVSDGPQVIPGVAPGGFSNIVGAEPDGR
jgi:hypothetical protein